MRKLLSEGAWARWGLLASAILLGAALMLASWSNYRSARDATTALYLGQGRILERELMGALRGASRPGETPISQAVLDSLLTEHAAEGLTYVALLDASGAPMESAGEAAPATVERPIESGQGPGFRLTLIGSRVRMTMFRGRPDGPPREEREEHHRYGGIIFEFDPLIAGRLMDRARQLQFYGVAAAIVMMLVAAISWGISRRYEREKGNREHERRLRLLGQMSAVLAHEIRNPLASLKGNAQLLAEHVPPGSSDRRKADRVVLEASRLEALTSDLLDFVRMGPLDRTSVDPTELLRASAEEVDPQGFDLDTRDAPERWSLDGPRMRQVFTNLLRNARQASPDAGPRPEAAVRIEHGRLIVMLRDYGEGLPKGQEARIFDPFFTTRTTGTGLGLAVARRIVELHGGELTASNHPDGGAVFRIALPGES